MKLTTRLIHRMKRFVTQVVRFVNEQSVAVEGRSRARVDRGRTGTVGSATVAYSAEPDSESVPLWRRMT